MTFSSFRYDHLCMYALSCRPASLSVSPDGTHLALCGQVAPATASANGDAVASSPAATAGELMVLSLPEKLLCSTARQEGLAAKRDFAFKAGAREKDAPPFIQVDLLHEQSAIKGVRVRVTTLSLSFSQVQFFKSSSELLTLNRESISHWMIKKGTGTCISCNYTFVFSLIFVVVYVFRT